MVGLFAFSMILGSIIFLLTRWQETTSLTRIQRSLATDAREAIQLIMKDVREASYIYHWGNLDVTIATDEIPGSSAFDPYQVKTGYLQGGGSNPDGTWMPAVTVTDFAAGAKASVGNLVGAFGLGEDELDKRLDGNSEESNHTLALVSLSAGGMGRPTYIVYFAAPVPDSDDQVHSIYRFQFQPTAEEPADTWYPMDRTFAAQAPATRSLQITANPGGAGVITKVTGTMADVAGTWRLQKLFDTVNGNSDDPSVPSYVRGLFTVRQLHPWSNETPISPLLVEATIVPSQRYGGRIASFALFDRAYARNVALPSAE